MNDTIVICNTFGMGNSKLPNLPLILIEKYFTLLLQSEGLPAAICFYTDGVQLVTSHAPDGVTSALKQLEKKGVRLIACSTCLEAMNMKENVVVGIAGGMTDIIEAQMQAGKVITL